MIGVPFLNIHEFVIQLLWRDRWAGEQLCRWDHLIWRTQHLPERLVTHLGWNASTSEHPLTDNVLCGIQNWVTPTGKVKCPIHGCYKQMGDFLRQARWLESEHSQIWNAISLRTFSPSHTATWGIVGQMIYPCDHTRVASDLIVTHTFWLGIFHGNIQISCWYASRFMIRHSYEPMFSRNYTAVGLKKNGMNDKYRGCHHVLR